MQTLTTIWGEKQKEQTKDVSLQPMLDQDQTRMEEIDVESDESEQAEEAPLVASSSNTYDDCNSELGTLLHPNRQRKEGSTAHYAQFDTESTKSLKLFRSYLESLDGGEKSISEVKQCAVDVSKYLCFASIDRYVNWHAIMDADKIKAYLQKLTDDGIKIDGRIEKLERIRYALSFVLVEADLTEENRKTVETVSLRLKKWQSVMRKSRIGNQMRREQEQANNPPEISCVGELLDNTAASKIEEIVADAAAGKDLPLLLINKVATYLLAVLLYGNSQRPGAILSITMQEYENRIQYRDGDESYTLLKVYTLFGYTLHIKWMCFSSTI